MRHLSVGAHSVARWPAVFAALAAALVLAGPSDPAGRPTGTSSSGGKATAAGTGASQAGVTTGGDRSATSADRRAEPGQVEVTGTPAPTGTVRIHQIQGRSHRSPLAGRRVTRLPGVVTALAADGLWIQDDRPDSEPATSEGVYVFTRTRPSLSVGDRVEVDGLVGEFRPAGSGAATLGRTEIDATRVTVTARGAALPEPVVLGPSGRRAPTSVIENNAQDDVEAGQTGDGFDVQEDALDFYESLEGMLVAVDDAVVVGPRSTSGEVTVLPAKGAGASVRSARGGIVLRPGDANPERLILDDSLTALPAADVGDLLPGRHVGVLDFADDAFRLLPGGTPRLLKAGPPAESTRPQLDGEVAVATLDVDNLDPSDPPEQYAAHAREIVERLRSPDLLVIEKLQDNSGTEDDGTVAADQTVAQLIAAISTAGGPAYDWRSIDPRDNADGGHHGGNIRVGFLFRADRGLDFVDRPTGTVGTAGATDPSDTAATTTATVAVDDGTGKARLTLSPGRVNPGVPAWNDVRKPLAGEFTWGGRTVFVIANHWTEPGEDDPLYGRRQPPRQAGGAQRLAQARIVADFVTSIRTIDADASVVVAGKLNDGESSAPLKALTRQTGLVDLPARLPVPERYTAVVDGNSRLLDHILVSPGAHPPDFDIVHTTAELAADPSGGQDGGQDPSVARIIP